MEQDLLESSDLYRKARALMNEKKFEDAVVLFQESAALDPHFKTLELLGETYICLNRLKDAIIPLAAAVSLNKGVRAASLLAEVFLRLNKLTAAREIAETALSREPNNRKALNILKVLAEIEGQK
jgi:tetratricopeptide (TPR) repeat protein